MHTYLIEMLECPACHSELEWNITEHCGNRIEKAEARCVACAASYPVREGIATFLTPDLPREDLWEQQGSYLIPGPDRILVKNTPDRARADGRDQERPLHLGFELAEAQATQRHLLLRREFTRNSLHERDLLRGNKREDARYEDDQLM